MDIRTDMSQQQVMIAHLVQDNSTLLTELKNLLSTLSSSQFSCASPHLQSGSVGAHVRHIFDHYDALFSDVSLVNYDQRARSLEVETDLQAATAKLKQIVASLSAIEQDRSIEVLNTTNKLRSPAPCLSSVARELNFLHSHTTHHMAIIRLLCLHLKLDVDANFGKAMSTQKFEQDVQS